MTEFNELYMEVILDHNKNPRNKGVIDDHTNHADGHNPLCGDKISLDLIIEDIRLKILSSRVRDALFLLHLLVF